MKISKLLKGSVIALATLGMMAPQAIYAAQPAQQQTVVKDVALQANGALNGFVVDANGTAVQNSQVQIGANGQLVATTATGANGQFTVTGLQGGVYQIVTANGSGTYRLWAENTAPPAAHQQVMVLSDASVRGQSCGCAPGGCTCGGGGGFLGGAGGGILGNLANPWVLGGIVAAAVAIPLALDDDDAS